MELDWSFPGWDAGDSNVQPRLRPPGLDLHAHCLFSVPSRERVGTGTHGCGQRSDVIG